MLPQTFYQRSDVTEIAKDLLGKELVCSSSEGLTSGIIVEVEAYSGAVDKASHAYGLKKTRRTETMFRQGGVAYVYLCYGIHHLFNVVTNTEGNPDAVLIRAVEPLQGLDLMKVRRNSGRTNNLTSGPGKLSQALGIKTAIHNNMSLRSNLIYVRENPNQSVFNTVTGKRIRIDYAGEDKHLPWRYYIEGNPYISQL